MAIPIKETPILTGKNASDFVEKAEKIINSERTKEEIELRKKIFKIYNKVKDTHFNV